MTQHNNHLKHFSERIRQKTKDYHSGGSIIIVAFGDSVTMGATLNGQMIPDDVYHQRLKKMLEKRYPAIQFSIINSGIGGDDIHAGIKRMDRDVIRYQPDLVLVAFGLNDAGGNPDGADVFQQKLSNVVQQIKEQTQADIILLTPNFMNTRAEITGPDLEWQKQFAELSSRFSRIQQQNKLAGYATAIRQTGSAYQVPVADVYQAWEQLEKSGTDIMDLLANRLNHPIASAHQITAEAIFQVISAD